MEDSLCEKEVMLGAAELPGADQSSVWAVL